MVCCTRYCAVEAQFDLKRAEHDLHTATINVRFHAEIPMLALPCLVHLPVALLLPVLGRGGRVDDGRVSQVTITS